MILPLGKWGPLEIIKGLLNAMSMALPDLILKSFPRMQGVLEGEDYW